VAVLWKRIVMLISLPHGQWVTRWEWFWHWLGGKPFTNGISYHVSQFAAANVVLFLLLGARSLASEDEARRRVGGWWFVLALPALLGGYLLLPMSILWPTYWFGVCVRFVVPLFLVAVVAVRPRRRGLGPLFVAPAVALSLGYGLYVTYMLHVHWERDIVREFRQAIAVIPPGQRVLYLSPVGRPRVMAFDHAYLGQYYGIEQGEKGGIAYPIMSGHADAMWVTPTFVPPSPTWGDPHQFRWARHGPYYHYFLVEDEVAAAPGAPLFDAPPGVATLLYQHGRWRVYRGVAPSPR
jgi:hypothetical protein